VFGGRFEKGRGEGHQRRVRGRGVTLAHQKQRGGGKIEGKRRKNSTRIQKSWSKDLRTEPKNIRVEKGKYSGEGED